MKQNLLFIFLIFTTLIYSCENPNSLIKPDILNSPNKTAGVDSVGLNYFEVTVSGDSVVLTWITEFEINNYGFEIQESADNVTFEKIGFVEGQGTTDIQTEYSFSFSEDESLEKYYRLKIIDFDSYFTYLEVIQPAISLMIPSHFELHQNFPNPFSGSTTIQYTLSKSVFVTVTVYDEFFSPIATLLKEYQRPGMYSVHYSSPNLKTGLYCYELKAGNLKKMKTMLNISEN